MCGKSCGHPAANSAISSSTFSLLAIIFAIGAAASSQFIIQAVIPFTFSTTSNAFIFFSFTNVCVVDVTSSTNCQSYQAFLDSQCQGLCPSIATAQTPTTLALRSALQNAPSAGSAAIAFYALAVILWLIHTVSSIGFACNLRTKEPAPPCSTCFSSAGVGMTFCALGFVCFVIAAAIGWAVFSALARAGFNYVVANPTVLLGWSSIIWYGGPGAALSGVALAFALVSLCCEMGARFCCKDWKPPAAELAGAFPSNTIVVQPAWQQVAMPTPVYAPAPVGYPVKQAPPGIEPSGAIAFANPVQQQPQLAPQQPASNPQAPEPAAPEAPGVVQVGSTPPPRPPPPSGPPPGQTWRAISDGKATCACAQGRTLRTRLGREEFFLPLTHFPPPHYCCPLPPPLTPHTHT